MNREFTFEWSPELVRAGARRFASRSAGRSLAIVAAILLLAIVVLVAGWGGCLWWFVALLAVVYFSTWLGYYRKVARIAELMPDRKVTVRIAPESLAVETTEHTSIMKWSRIRRLWVFPDIVLLFTYDQNTYSLLPTGPLGEDGRRFIEEKVREHGGQVR